MADKSIFKCPKCGKKFIRDFTLQYNNWYAESYKYCFWWREN